MATNNINYKVNVKLEDTIWYSTKLDIDPKTGLIVDDEVWVMNDFRWGVLDATYEFLKEYE